MNPVIREIEEQDYPALLPLWNDELGVRTVTAENIGARYDRVKGDSRYKTFVALLDGKVIGFVSSVQSYGAGSASPYTHIVGIAVTKEKQNQGIGTQLLRHMENDAKDSGSDCIILCSGVKRTDAHAFYQRNGYSKDSWCFDKSL